MRHKDRPGPLSAVVAGHVIEPQGTDVVFREIVLARASKQPNPAFLVRDEPGQIIMRQALARLGFLSRLAAFAARLDGRHAQVVDAPATPGARQRINKAGLGFKPRAVLEDGQSYLAVLIQPDALVAGISAPVLAPRRAALFPGNPQRAFGVIGERRASLVIL